jgi:hypothetical protein
MSDEPLGKEALQERLGQSPFISLLNLTVVSDRPAEAAVGHARGNAPGIRARAEQRPMA